MDVRRRRDDGFTLIELLVVMIILSILAAVAIPAFHAARSRGKATAAKSDAAAVGRQIATVLVDGSPTSLVLTPGPGAWTLTAVVDGVPTAYEGRFSSENLGALAWSPADPQRYCVSVTPDSGETWSYGGDGLTRGGTCP